MTTSTREKAEELLQQILLDGTAEDGEVLMHLLQGLRDKQTGFHLSGIFGIYFHPYIEIH